jgi:hypothetical protein
MRCAIRFGLVVVLMAATVVFSQTRARTSPRPRTRAEVQQDQMMMSPQMGQPDFARRMAERHARTMQEMQQDMEQMQRWAEESRNRSIQQALRASDDQWRQIKPKLDRIERLKAEAEVATAPGGMPGPTTQQFSMGGPVQGQGFMMGGSFGGGFGGGGGNPGRVDIMDPNGSAAAEAENWGGSWSSNSRSIMEMTEGEALCQDLQHLLQSQNAPSAEVLQKVEALRRVRARAREDLAKARLELRTLTAPQQEPALIVMGYLD